MSVLPAVSTSVVMCVFIHIFGHYFVYRAEIGNNILYCNILQQVLQQYCIDGGELKGIAIGMGGGGSHNTIAIYCNILYQAIMIDDSSSRGAARKNRLLQFREFSYDISHVGQIQCHQRKSVVRITAYPKRSKVLKQIINSTYIPIIIAESRIIAVITLYRYIFDFLEFQKFEKTATFPRIARH